MNIRFLAQSEFFNGTHLKDDIILEKEYEKSAFKNLKKVHYYIYHLEDNVREEILPRMDKLDIFHICDCMIRSNYVYFTEYDDQYDGTCVFNIIKYNFITGDYSTIITLKDDINHYPGNKQIKIFILDDSNLILQRAIKRKNLQDNYKGFFDFSSLLYNFVENKQTPIIDENLTINGIDYILPFNENVCVLKTGFSLIVDNRHELLSKEEASVESLIMINISQFISDLLLKQSNMVMQTLDQCFYDMSISYAKIIDNYLIYSKYEFDKNDEYVNFLNLTTRDSLECINRNITDKDSMAKNYIIQGIPHIRLDKDDKIEFINLETKEVAVTYPKNTEIVYVNNNVLIGKYRRKALLGGFKDFVRIYTYPSTEITLQEKGKYIGAIASDDDTTYIFLK